MNSHELIRNKNRRQTEQRKLPKIQLDLSQVNNSKLKYSISSRQKRKSNHSKNNPTNLNIKNYIYANPKKLVEKNISIHSTNSKRYSNNYPFRKSLDNNNKINAKERHSMYLVQTKTKKFYQKYNLKLNNNIQKKKKSVGDYENLSKYELNHLEYNIQNVLNNMRMEIEKQTKKSEEKDTVTPQITKNKLVSSPNLIFFFKKKKNKKHKKSNLQSSLLMKETHLINYSFKKKKRNNSFTLSEKAKKKLLSKFKSKLLKRSTERLTIINNNNSLSDDSDKNNENNQGFALLPTSNIIFIFDLLLIIADLYTFVVIPLTVAQNKYVREKEHIIQQIIHYSIDIIFLFDFIISFFRGYYDYEMNIVINNKKIIYNYFKSNFFLDFLQAIPLYTIIRIFMKPKRYFYLGYSGAESIIITFLLFLKPLKIFKIIKKKQNKALENFFSYLSENYYLEKFVLFLFYFIIFFLFIHLFICIHIYFAYQGFPNWITHINIINYSFSGKYITSLYFMITTMTTVGYGDIICVSPIERIYHIILLVIGTLLYTFLVSKMGNYLREQSHEEIKLSKDLNILENIRITYPSMSYKLYSKIKSHLLTIFNKRKKTGLSLLINGVPDAIKNDLLFKIYSRVINQFSIFKDVKNSNFVIQVLTSFIPIVTKKEEIIILEGEIIENIVFIKDGRLSIEIGIDLNDPNKSIQKYIDNFTGISRQEEASNNYLSRDVSVMNFIPEKNFNDLKAEIDNVLLDNQNTLVNNSRIDNNGISVDLGRLDFSRNEIERCDSENYHIIKILDLRKNEHFGDYHLITEKPSPFTLKSKSRIAELLLIRKHDAIILSKNFQNIWRRIENKSYHNLVSIKKLTFKILKRYYNTYFYKNNKETPVTFNLDTTRKSFFENQPSFIRNLKTLNMSKNISRKKTNMKDKINLNKKDSITNINKNKLFIGYEKKRKISGDDFTSELNFSSDTFDSNSIKSSNFKISNSIIKKNKEFIPIININDVENENSYSYNPINRYKNSNISKDVQSKVSSKCCVGKKSMENFTFKYDTDGNKFNLSSSKKLLSLKKTKYSNFKSSKELKNSININNYDTIIKSQLNSQKPSDKTLEKKSSINETVRYHSQNMEDLKSDNNDMYIFTLEDINQKFSKKIKRKIKKRKRIQKLKEMLKFQRLKINKNLIDSFIKQNSLKYKLDNNNNKDILINSNLNYSISSSNKKIFSKLLDSTTSDATSTLIQNNHKFGFQTLKIISSESFEIESNYQNLNSLSKGKMAKNRKFKKFMESIMSKYINQNSSFNVPKVDVFSSFYPKRKKQGNFGEIMKYNETEYKNNNDDLFFSEGNLTPISKSKYNNITEEIKSSNKNFNLKNEKTIENLGSLGADKKTTKYKSSSKLFEKELENFTKTKHSTFKKKDIEEKSKNDYIDNSIYKNNLERKYINREKGNKNKKEIINNNLSNNDINNKSIKSSLNAFKEYDKYYNSTNENKLSILNKNNDNIDKKRIQNNNEDEKAKKCYIY